MLKYTSAALFVLLFASLAFAGKGGGKPGGGGGGGGGEEGESDDGELLAQAVEHNLAPPTDPRGRPLRRKPTMLRFRCGACMEIIKAGKKAGKSYALPAYDQCIAASHLFNLLDARGVISATERQSYILRVRTLSKACCEAWLESPQGRSEGAGVVDAEA